jgi:hypothetical protein
MHMEGNDSKIALASADIMDILEHHGIAAVIMLCDEDGQFQFVNKFDAPFTCIDRDVISGEFKMKLDKDDYLGNEKQWWNALAETSVAFQNLLMGIYQVTPNLLQLKKDIEDKMIPE